MGSLSNEKLVNIGQLLEKPIHVQLVGGREVSGILRGYDSLLNLVITGSIEHRFDSRDDLKCSLVAKRTLGLIIVRGSAIMMIAPTSQFVEIANPFTENT